LQNIQNILVTAGSGMDRVLTCNAYISSMEHKEEMNQAYRKFFSTNPPARCTVAVAGIDNNLDIEIEVIAGTY
jgi:2-iminobutanoate/2-iminopropanoate deaminase